MQPDSPLHGLEGLKHMESAIVPGIYDSDARRRGSAASTPRTRYMLTRRLAREEGLLVGISSGAALAASARRSPARSSDGVIVTIFRDGAEKYLSERFWEDPPEGSS